jgi:hypothetical protein
MPNVEECLAHCQFLISKGRGQEAAVLYLPRLEAQRRKANREKRKRIVWDVDEVTYSRFNAERDRWMQVCVNKTATISLMCDVLAAVPEGTIRSLLEQGSDE